MKSTLTKPLGSTFFPSILCTLAGVALATGLFFMKFHQGVDAYIADFWTREPFQLTQPIVVEFHWSWVVAAIYGWIVSILTLHSARNWRRLLVGLMLITTLIAFHPVFTLWNILWQPTLSVTAVLWAWLCAVIYAAQHTMPCETHSDHVAIVTDATSHKKECMKVKTVPFPSKKPIPEKAK